MIIIKNTPLIIELRKFLSFFRLNFKQYFFFYYLNLVRSKRIKNKSEKESNTIIFSTSNTQYRSWHSYQKLISIPSKKITNKFDRKGEFIKYIRIIIPKGLRSLRTLQINTKEINTKEKNKNLNKADLIFKEYFFNKKQLAYFRNLNKIDIKLNSKIKEFSVNSNGSNIGVQIFKSVSEEKSNLPNTIYVVLDAVSYESFLNSETYKTFLSKSKHFLCETFSPSSLTGSALPSLLTLKPVFCHLLGDYDEWFFSPKLECLSKDIQTIGEKLKELQDLNAFTSFSKTMPFYGYYRGFNYYYNRCSGNNFSPSSLEMFFSHLIENKEFINSIGSSFNFIHDIGGHPPVFPSFDKKNNLHNNLAYSNSVDISLRKIKSLIINLDSDQKLNNTNLIITGDHTESFCFKRTNFSLFPERISVPVFFKPSIKTDISFLNDLTSNSEKLPSIFVISKILEKIYNLEFSHPEFNFDGISWISSVYKYPKRKIIYTLGYDERSQEYYCAEILKSIFYKSEGFNSYNFKPRFFKFKTNKLSLLNNDSQNLTRLSQSFRKYLYSCKSQISFPIEQYFF